MSKVTNQSDLMEEVKAQQIPDLSKKINGLKAKGFHLRLCKVFEV